MTQITVDTLWDRSFKYPEGFRGSGFLLQECTLWVIGEKIECRDSQGYDRDLSFGKDYHDFFLCYSSTFFL